MQQERFEPAIDSFRQALRVEPGQPYTHRSLADALLRAGQTDDALRHYRRALQIKPDDLDSMNRLAWIQATHADERFRNAIDALTWADRACAAAPQNAAFRDTRAAALAAAGRFAEAEDELRRALQLASTQGHSDHVARMQVRLELYRAGQPYRR